MWLVQAEGLGQFWGDLLNQHAQPAARNLAAAFELVHHVHRHIDGNREGQTLIAAGAAVNLRVDADHLAVEIEQRPAGVAGIDGGVGLDERHVVIAGQVAAQRADDALGGG